LIAFDGDLDIPLAPDEESHGSQDKEDSDKDPNDLLPFWAQIQILKKIELIESNKEGKDGHVLLRKNPEEISHDTPSKTEVTSLAFGQSPLDVKHKRQEVKHPSHAGHPLNDVGHRLGLNGMRDED
jgi:hypothetical protein